MLIYIQKALTILQLTDMSYLLHHISPCLTLDATKPSLYLPPSVPSTVMYEYVSLYLIILITIH